MTQDKHRLLSTAEFLASPAQMGKGSVMSKVRPKQLIKSKFKFTLKDYIYERKRNDMTFIKTHRTVNYFYVIIKVAPI